MPFLKCKEFKTLAQIVQLMPDQKPAKMNLASEET